MSFNYQVIIKVVGIITTIIGVSMIPSLIVALIYGENEIVIAFLKSIIPVVITGLVIVLKIKPLSISLKLRDGYLIVGICWILASTIGTFPYIYQG